MRQTSEMSLGCVLKSFGEDVDRFSSVNMTWWATLCISERRETTYDHFETFIAMNHDS